MPICGTITELLEGRMRRGGGQDRGHLDEDVIVDERERGRAERMGGSPCQAGLREAERRG